MKKIALTLSLIAFVFTGCFSLFDDDECKTNDRSDNSYCTNTYNSYKYRHDYRDRKSNIRQKSITPAKPKSTSETNSKLIHRKK